jgi:hypothetical protein
MAEPTLQQVLGANATQTADEIVISKADLGTTGLIASANNKPESLLTAIVLKAMGTLTTANQDANPDQSITFEAGLSSFTRRNDVDYRRDQITMNLEKPDADAVINPNDY